MQEVEKILEEMQEVKEIMLSPQNIDCFGDPCKENDCCACVINKCMEIVKKHMNDGWIPVERLPEKNEYFVETSSDKDFPNGYYKRLEIAYMTDTIEYVHGYYDVYKWMDKYLDTIKNVVAWRIHEPYRPERSDNHDGE